MTQAPEPGTAQTGSVTRLRPPPVRQSTIVRSDIEHTFDAFVRTIGAWWPVDPFSSGQDRVRDIVIERQPGGRVYESWADGTEVDWGELLAWEPPDRFVMTWVQTPVPTEVELSFTALGPALTRITAEHRGWEALTDEQLAQDCALPGGYSTGSYSVGWAEILARAAAALSPAGDTGPPASGPPASGPPASSRPEPGVSS
jgi:uncharacterized protein YndB with AHSA1/START domain